MPGVSRCHLSAPLLALAGRQVPQLPHQEARADVPAGGHQMIRRNQRKWRRMEKANPIFLFCFSTAPMRCLHERAWSALVMRLRGRPRRRDLEGSFARFDHATLSYQFTLQGCAAWATCCDAMLVRDGFACYRVLLLSLPPFPRAMLRSQAGPHAGAWFTAIR